MKNRILAGLAAAFLAPAVSWAQQAYLGGGIGQGHTSLPSLTAVIQGAAVTGQAGTTRDTSYKIYGGYQFDQNWGLELGYNHLGTGYTSNITVAGTAGSASYGVSNWYFAGTGTLPLSDSGFGLQGKLGIVRNSLSGGSLCALGVCVSPNDTTRTQALFGVGLKYSFNKNISGLLEYEDYGKVTGDNPLSNVGVSGGAVKANSWNLSLRYDF